MGDTLRVATLPESHGAHRSQGSDCQPGVVADFGRSCLPGSTSRLAATSVHVNRQYRLAVSLERRTRFACGESPFRQTHLYPEKVTSEGRDYKSESR